MSINVIPPIFVIKYSVVFSLSYSLRILGLRQWQYRDSSYKILSFSYSYNGFYCSIWVSNRPPAIYLSPVSHATVTTVFPGPNSLANLIAATTFIPVEVPARIPSFQLALCTYCALQIQRYPKLRRKDDHPKRRPKANTNSLYMMLTSISFRYKRRGCRFKYTYFSIRIDLFSILATLITIPATPTAPQNPSTPLGNCSTISWPIVS